MGRPGLYWISMILPVFLLLALHQLAQPPAPTALRPKIFVIGLSKTGTTSIGDALERLGYRRLGWRDIRSRYLVHTWANGDLEPAIQVTRHYDAFEDLPWPKLYREMAKMYPDAKFILSLRAHEEDWLRSMQTHVGRGVWLPHAYFYGADTFEGNRGVILESYRRHIDEVRDYFADQPGRLVEMNIDKGDANWAALCLVAQCPGGQVPRIAFPRSNTAASWDMDLVSKNVNWYKGWVITRTEEVTTWYYYDAGGTRRFKALLRACWKAYDIMEQAYTQLYFMLVSPLVLPSVDQ